MKKIRGLFDIVSPFKKSYDKEKIESDWKKVGNDMRKGILKYDEDKMQ